MIDKLLELAKTLRSDMGCPWDRKQTLNKYPKRLLEESQEIAEALENKDMENLKEEIGDVLFNLCMMMQIAEEEGHFTADEVVQSCAQKIESRHSWVFGEDKAETPEEALQLWELNKANEKKS